MSLIFFFLLNQIKIGACFNWLTVDTFYKYYLLEQCCIHIKHNHAVVKIVGSF